MKRKSGSCSTAGRVSFDIDLLRQHADFRKRVIVEELLHLRFPNHGKLFKSILAATSSVGIEAAVFEGWFNYESYVHRLLRERLGPPTGGRATPDALHKEQP